MGRVLIVNENTSIRGEDRRCLNGAGFRVREADDIYSANDIIYENEVDVVLVDETVSGGKLFVDVTKRFHPSIPVILLGFYSTASTRRPGNHHDRRAGMADLLGRVATAIGRRRNRLENGAGGGVEKDMVNKA